ncbi:hypothetical protein GB928_025605 [Shinella curvata]|uniref:Uncharacterized protein n=1 Tax=Shinella curvata TaxID=1817964 RepID=A0ABT8XLH1_9HYPH|nr:hypothetical protein [Shinella curvata]MCJ8056965.1 hypothetical protein [Shinella curvata]MDO6124569.1 hypothetical protein [Shinella curvata]
MHGLSDFIAELIRAANDVERLPESTKLRLLGRAYVTIINAREEIESQRQEAYRQAGADLISVTGHVGALSSQDVKSLLLDAAEMIRQIKIVIDSKGKSSGEGD